ncbi:MAG: biotin/lipoate A/B protein ligase family protein [Anaerolineales bacterium]
MTSETMRLIISPAQAGSLNMAIDTAIMEGVGDGLHPPTLRLYAWQPACLSLGYTQSEDDIDMHRLAARAWDVVRRPTGGRAILHVDELTYSIALPQAHPLVEGDIVTSYRRLSTALQAGLQYLGITPETAPYMKNNDDNAVCFVKPSAYEIMVEGRKLIGSAQVRRQKAVLQHGSLPLSGDLGRICDVLQYADEAARHMARQQVYQRATTLAEVLPSVVTWEQAAQAMRQGFENTFGLELQEETLSASEALRAEQLRHERYHQTAWTARQ